MIEVGLGGRLDGTNVIEPLVAAITSIGFDHTEVLGSTLEADRAREGRHRQARRAARARRGAAARRTRVIERYAAEVGAPQSCHVARFADDAPAAGRSASSSARMRRRRSPCSNSSRWAAAEPRRDRARVRAAGDSGADGVRLRQIRRCVFDIAHNAEKATSLVASLRERFAGRRIHYVVAIGESKDARRYLARSLRRVAVNLHVHVVYGTPGRRAIPPATACSDRRVVRQLGARHRRSRSKRCTVARRIAEIDDLVVVTGSTFVVAELREWFAPTPVVRGVLDLRGAANSPGARARTSWASSTSRPTRSRATASRMRRKPPRSRWRSGRAAPISSTSAANRRGPGTSRSTNATEIARVVPVIGRSAQRSCPRRFRSTRTSRTSCARRTRPAPTSSTRSGERRRELLDAAAELGIPIVAMHNQNGNGVRRRRRRRGAALSRRLCGAGRRRAASRRNASFSIPGIGFGKTADQNIAVLRALDRVVALGLSDDARHLAQIDDRQADRPRGRRSRLRHGRDDRARGAAPASTSCACTTLRRARRGRRRRRDRARLEAGAWTE